MNWQNDWACRTVRVLYWANVAVYLNRRGGSVRPGPHVSMYDGGTSRSNGRRLKPSWPLAVQFIREHRLLLNTAMHVAFMNWAKPTAPPPTVFYSPWLTQQYATFAETLRHTTQNQLESQLATFRSECAIRAVEGENPQMVQAQVLRSAQVPLTALFRSAIAEQCGLQDVVDHFREQALWQYLTAPLVYARFWDRLLPESIRRTGDQVLARYASENLPCEGPRA